MPTQTDIAAVLAAMQDQLDDLTAVVRAQQATIERLTSASASHPHPATTAAAGWVGTTRPR